MKPTYKIKDWDAHFENHDSKRISNARWLPMPNKHDGKSYRRIAAHRDGVAVFAAWTLMLQVASKMPVRGVLEDEDGPLDADDLSAMTGFPSEIFTLAFDLLTHERVGWLESSGSERVDIPLHRDTPRYVAFEGNRTTEQGNTEQKKKKEDGSRDKSRSPNTDSAQLDAKGCDEEFLERLQQSKAYSMLNVRVEFDRMVIWCQTHSKQPTKRRLIAWLNRADRPMEAGNGSNKPRFESAPERNARNLRENVAYIRGLSNSDSKANCEDPIGMLASGNPNR